MTDKIEHKSFEFKFVADTGTLEGYASKFGELDSAHDIVAPGAFQASLAAAKAAGRLPPMLWQHNWTQPIGRWDDMAEDQVGLRVKGTLVMETQQAREAHALIKNNVVTGLSIGYRVLQSSIDEKTGARVLEEIELLEISLVTFPALDSARVDGLKAAPKTEREFEEFLRDAGYSRSEAKAITAAGFKSLQRDADGLIDSLKDLGQSMKIT